MFALVSSPPPAQLLNHKRGPGNNGSGACYAIATSSHNITANSIKSQNCPRKGQHLKCWWTSWIYWCIHRVAEARSSRALRLLRKKICSPSLIELSGNSSQHENAQLIHAGWASRLSMVQEIIDNLIMCQVSLKKRCRLSLPLKICLLSYACVTLLNIHNLIAEKWTGPAESFPPPLIHEIWSIM